MKLDLRSTTLGALFGLLPLLALGFQVPTGSLPKQGPWSVQGLTIDGVVQVEGIPTPQQLIAVYEVGATIIPTAHAAVAPYTVPDGKLFVATGLGSTYVGHVANVPAKLFFNGTKVLTAHVYEKHQPTNQMMFGGGVADLRHGIAAPAGTVIEVNDDDGATPIAGEYGVVLGYLVDA